VDDAQDEAIPQSNIDAVLSQQDTPTERADICKLSIEHLDAMLDAIRARRLVRVQKLEAIARVRADETRLENFMRYERLVKQARTVLKRAEELELKAEAAIHKVRMVVMAIEMEVGEDA
jgi:hypothetical protein